MKDPKAREVALPEFEKVWQVIKKWDRGRNEGMKPMTWPRWYKPRFELKNPLPDLFYYRKTGRMRSLRLVFLYFYWVTKEVKNDLQGM
jgi:hypothetical protein